MITIMHGDAQHPRCCVDQQPQHYHLGSWAVHPDSMDLETELTVSDREVGNQDVAATGSCHVLVGADGIVASRPTDSASPLYYHATDHQITISTSFASIMSRSEGEFDHQALVEHLAYGMPTGGRTYLRDVGQVPLGCQIRWNTSGTGRIRSALSLLPAPDGHETDAPVEAVLEEVLKPWSEHRHAVMLSGGIDSMLLYRAIYRSAPPKPTISADYWFYRGRGPEQHYATSAAAHLRAEHHVEVASERDFLTAMIRATDAAQAPLPGLQSVLIHSLTQSRLLHGPTALICGQGADALFGGPASAATDWTVTETTMPQQPSWRMACAALGVAGDPTVGRRQVMDLVSRSSTDPAHRWRHYELVTHADKGMLTWSASARYNHHRVAYPYLHPHVVGLAHRHVASLDPAKPLLRQAAARVGIPAALLERPKLSFGPTGSGWARHLSSASWLVEDLVDRDTMDVICAGSDYTFWNLLTFAVWRRLFLFRTSVDEVIETLTSSMAADAPKFRIP